MNTKITESNIARFWAKVDKSGDCWLWTGSCQGRNRCYGQWSANYKLFGAHRFAYLISIGGIPKGLFVCHKCNEKKCVKPEHLYLATNSQNLQDAVKDGVHGTVKYSLKLAEEIRAKHAEGYRICQLVDIFNMPWTSLSDMIKNKTWKRRVNF